ncbi:DNA/RNA nuclease SfsA [Desulforegula conservatrix]|uniref:DNA/RNA nuclease SfsA n=1 Tax=Desulforegula conservatrix TaxID=153026 RepID=UPI00042270EC|nr:DNA/RNA nuclease SfsA [Desulforegula conservatrix]
MNPKPVYKILSPAFIDLSVSYRLIRWPKLIPGILVKRYKRFLADIKLDDGTIITAHCPNSGSMKTCSEPGMGVWISESANPKRKLSCTWEIIEMPGSMVGVNAILPNRLVKDAITYGLIQELSGYSEIIPEITTSEGTRLDLCLRSHECKPCYIEIKNSTYVEEGRACFPDAVTSRGKKHVEELERLANEGFRSVILFIVQRMDSECFSPADHIDPAYGKSLRKAVANGVEIIAYDTLIDLKGINIRNKIPVML